MSDDVCDCKPEQAVETGEWRCDKCGEVWNVLVVQGDYKSTRYW